MTDSDAQDLAGPATDDELFVALSQQLEQLGTQVGQLTGLADEVANLRKELDGLLDRVPSGPVPTSRRFRPERITPPQIAEDEAVLRHAEVARWVRWLVGTYQLEEVVQPCWERHDALVEELTALYVAWAGAWSGDERPDQAVVWHSQLSAAHERLKRWQGACRPDRCTRDLAGREVDFNHWHERYQAEQGRLDCGAGYRVARALHGLPAPFPLLPPPPDKLGGQQ